MFPPVFNFATMLQQTSKARNLAAKHLAHGLDAVSEDVMPWIRLYAFCSLR